MAGRPCCGSCYRRPSRSARAIWMCSSSSWRQLGVTRQCAAGVVAAEGCLNKRSRHEACCFCHSQQRTWDSLKLACGPSQVSAKPHCNSVKPACMQAVKRSLLAAAAAAAAEQLHGCAAGHVQHSRRVRHITNKLWHAVRSMQALWPAQLEAGRCRSCLSGICESSSLAAACRQRPPASWIYQGTMPFSATRGSCL